MFEVSFWRIWHGSRIFEDECILFACSLFTWTMFKESSWTVWFCDCSSLCRKDIWNCLVWYDCWRNLQDRLENWFQMYCGILDCRKGFVCDTAIRNAIENENSIALRSLWEGFSIANRKCKRMKRFIFGFAITEKDSNLQRCWSQEFLRNARSNGNWSFGLHEVIASGNWRLMSEKKIEKQEGSYILGWFFK